MDAVVDLLSAHSLVVAVCFGAIGVGLLLGRRAMTRAVIRAARRGEPPDEKGTLFRVTFLGCAFVAGAILAVAIELF